MLMFALVVAQMSFVTAAESDIEGHWAQASVEQWLELGLVNGYPDGSFKPNQDITRAEFVTLLDNVFGFERADADAYSDVSDDAYYAEAVYAASAAGVITGYNGTFRPDDSITREEAATVVARAYQLSEPAGIDYLDYSDSIAISSWAEAAVQALVEDGYMAGIGQNTLAPAANITRASALTLIGNVFGTYVSAEGEVTGVIDGNLFIAAQDVVLKDAVVNGSVFIAPSVGEGDVTIEDTTIDGTLVAMGGGENSVKLNNTSVKKLIVAKVGGKVRVYAEGTTQVDEVELHSGAKLEEGSGAGSKFGKVELLEIKPGEELILDGDFDEVVFETKVDKVTVLNGTVGKMEFTGDSDDTKVELSEDAVVTELVVKSRIDVSGEGKIVKATIEKSDSNIDVDVDEVHIEGDDVIVNIDGEEIAQDIDAPNNNNNNNDDDDDDDDNSPSVPVNRRLGVSINEENAPSRSEAFNISGPTTQNIDYIALQLMMEINDDFDNYYSKYENEGANILATLFIASTNMFDYVHQIDFSQTTNFKGFDNSQDYQNMNHKELTKKVLETMISQMTRSNNPTTVSSYEDDFKYLASQVPASQVSYNADPFVSVTIERQNSDSTYTQLAKYEKNASKSAFIDTVFQQLANTNMRTSALYRVTVVQMDTITKQEVTRVGTITLTSRY